MELLAIALIINYLCNLCSCFYMHNGRSSSLFSNFLIRNSGSLFSRRVTQQQFSFLELRVNSVEEKLENLQRMLADIETIVSLIKPRCPAGVGANSAVIGNQCIELKPTQKSFEDAQESCLLSGGRLAEPLYTDDDFYSNLITAIPITTPGITEELYLNIIGNGTNYKYVTSGLIIPDSVSRWESTPASGSKGSTAVLKSDSGLSWKLAEALNNLPNSPAKLRYYLCQYDTII